MLQRDYKVIVTGPTTIAAILNSLQMGFRTLAIEKRSSDVWVVLGAVKKEFTKFGDLLDKTHKKLQETKQNFYDELKLEKVPTKLQKFEELDFDDFVKEYAKAKKLKFVDKLEERNFKNEWQRLFENDKKEVLEIQNQINITDKEIDQMVYKLYDLTPDEIKIVENNE